MSRQHVTVPVPALALRRAEAAAALGVSVEVFDKEVRPVIAHVQLGGVVVYSSDALRAFIAAREEQPIASRRRAA